MSAPFGLIVQAWIFAFLVAIVAGFGLLAFRFELDSGWFIFWVLAATFLPVTVAADMGYLRGRAESLAKGKGQASVESNPTKRRDGAAANSQQPPDPTAPAQLDD